MIHEGAQAYLDHQRALNYRPGNGENVVYWRSDTGATHSRFREYHGPWPAPPREPYIYPQPPTVQDRVNAALKPLGVELDLDTGKWGEGICITLRVNGVTIADDEDWDE